MRLRTPLAVLGCIASLAVAAQAQDPTPYRGPPVLPPHAGPPAPPPAPLPEGQSPAPPPPLPEGQAPPPPPPPLDQNVPMEAMTISRATAMTVGGLESLVILGAAWLAFFGAPRRRDDQR